MTTGLMQAAVLCACVQSCGLARAQTATSHSKVIQQSTTATPQNPTVTQEDPTVTQQNPPVTQQKATATTAKSASTAAEDAGATQIDRVVAVVNDDLILESDVDEERRFVVFQPYSAPEGAFSRSQAIERLIDRTLILQQARVQPENMPTDAQVAANLADLRKDILACKQYKCETDAGWQSFLKANGFTQTELTKLWRVRMETLAFIEQRFRNGINVTDSEAREYYTKTLLPQYVQRKAAPPKFDTISDRIREILLQEQVSKLLDDWLKALRASGDVRMVTVGEAGQ